MNMNNQDLTKFEFLLTMEGNIVVQRFFSVKDYNPNVKKSLDLYNCVTSICEDICNSLKKKTFEFLTDNENYYLFNEIEDETFDNSNEHFLLEIKLGNDIFIQRTFPAYVYHPKIRYTVDIRPMIRTILSELTETLSLKEVETKYLQYNLNA